MIHDPDLIDEYRRPEYQPEHLSWDDGVERYEADSEFLNNAIDALMGVDPAEVPEPLRVALQDWFRTTDGYTDSVQYVIDEAAKW